MIHVHLLVITTCTVWPWCFQNLSHGYPRATKVYIHHPCIMEFQDHCIFIFRNFPYNNAFAWVVSKMTPAPVPSKKNAQPKTPGEAPGRSCRNCAAPAKLKSCHCTRHYGSVEILAGKKCIHGPWRVRVFFWGGWYFLGKLLKGMGNKDMILPNSGDVYTCTLVGVFFLGGVVGDEGEVYKGIMLPSCVRIIRNRYKHPGIEQAGFHGK